MTIPKNFAYYYEVIERDSWSGPSHDGYVIFLSQEDAQTFRADQYKDRTGPTPEYYVNYEGGAYVPVGPETYQTLLVQKKLWIKSQGDLLK